LIGHKATIGKQENRGVIGRAKKKVQNDRGESQEDLSLRGDELWGWSRD